MSKRSRDEAPDSQRKLFVSGLPYKMTWQNLKEHFQSVGEVIYAKVMMDRDTGLSRGLGVVEFDTASAASTAVKTLNGTQVMGRTLTVRFDNQSDNKEDKVLSLAYGASQSNMNNGPLVGGMLGPQSANLYGSQAINMGGYYGSSGGVGSMGAGMTGGMGMMNNYGVGNMGMSSVGDSNMMGGYASSYNGYGNSGVVASQQPGQQGMMPASYGGGPAMNAPLQLAGGSSMGSMGMAGVGSMGYSSMGNMGTASGMNAGVGMPGMGMGNMGLSSNSMMPGMGMGGIASGFSGMGNMGSGGMGGMGSNGMSPVGNMGMQGSNGMGNLMAGVNPMAGMGGMGNMGNMGSYSVSNTDSTSTRLFISNLNYDTSWQKLKDHFKRCGTVTYCTILKDKSSDKSKGCGVVEFQQAKDALAAIAQLQNSSLDGRQIFIREDQKDPGPMSLHQGGAALQQQALMASSMLQSNNSMGGMSNMQQMNGGMAGMNNSQVLHSVPSFGGYGVSSSTAYPSSTSMPRGSEMTQGSGGTSSRSSRGSEWGNAASYVDKKLCQVVVLGIPFSFDAQQLVDLVQSAGNILHARIPADDTGRSRGWGTVLFDSPSGAQNAINRFHRTEHNGRTLYVKADEKA